MISSCSGHGVARAPSGPDWTRLGVVHRVWNLVQGLNGGPTLQRSRQRVAADLLVRVREDHRSVSAQSDFIRTDGGAAPRL